MLLIPLTEACERAKNLSIAKCEELLANLTEKNAEGTLIQIPSFNVNEHINSYEVDKFIELVTDKIKTVQDHEKDYRPYLEELRNKDDDNSRIVIKNFEALLEKMKDNIKINAALSLEEFINECSKEFEQMKIETQVELVIIDFMRKNKEKLKIQADSINKFITDKIPLKIKKICADNDYNLKKISSYIKEEAVMKWILEACKKKENEFLKSGVSKKKSNSKTVVGKSK